MKILIVWDSEQCKLDLPADWECRHSKGLSSTVRTASSWKPAGVVCCSGSSAGAAVLVKGVRESLRRNGISVPIMAWAGSVAPTERALVSEAGANAILSADPGPDDFIGALAEAGPRASAWVALENAARQSISSLDSIERDLKKARISQLSLLREDAYPVMEGLKFDSIFEPCERLGGDIFDIFRLDETRIGFYLVSPGSPGIDAALASAYVKALSDSARYDRAAKMAAPPSRILSLMGEALRGFRIGDEVSIFYGTFDIENRLLSYSRAGELFPALYRTATKELMLLQKGGTIDSFIDNPDMDEEAMGLEPGDKLILYSYGVVSARRFSSLGLPTGEPFGSRRLHETIAENGQAPMKFILKYIHRELEKYTDHRQNSIGNVVLIGMEVDR